MLTTAGITFATARTTGSEAGSVGDDDGNGVGVCANKDCTADKRMIAVVDASMRAPPRTVAFNVPLYRIRWGRVKSPRKERGALSTVNLTVVLFLPVCFDMMRLSF